MIPLTNDKWCVVYLNLPFPPLLQLLCLTFFFCRCCSLVHGYVSQQHCSTSRPPPPQRHTMLRACRVLRVELDLTTRERMLKLAQGVVSGDRRSLARAITYVESVNEEHRTQADELLQDIAVLKAEKTRQAKPANQMCETFTRMEQLPSLRIAISGPPGAGKSCFIECLGMHLIGMGLRVAVLTIDPSSTISGGSLLGDKTRMDKLTVERNAYIRPTPSRGFLGGIAEATYDALQICEGAGFDVCLVETVGVGQSEVAARTMTDCFCLLLPPAGGDELQGIKKGIVEVADLVGITKADGSTLPLAKRTQAEYTKALQVRDCHHPPRSLTHPFSPHTADPSVRPLPRLEASCPADQRAHRRRHPGVLGVVRALLQDGAGGASGTSQGEQDDQDVGEHTPRHYEAHREPPNHPRQRRKDGGGCRRRHHCPAPGRPQDPRRVPGGECEPAGLECVKRRDHVTTGLCKSTRRQRKLLLVCPAAHPAGLFGLPSAEDVFDTCTAPLFYSIRLLLFLCPTIIFSLSLFFCCADAVAVSSAVHLPPGRSPPCTCRAPRMLGGFACVLGVSFLNARLTQRDAACCLVWFSHKAAPANTPPPPPSRSQKSRRAW